MRGLLAAWLALTGVAWAQNALESNAPEPSSRVDAQYTEEARIAGLEGSVQVTAAVNADGSVREVRLTRGLGLGLDEQAMQAVSQWRFPPGIGPSTGWYEVPFTLPSKLSHWHLVSVEFRTPDGAARPTFQEAIYPTGAGIGVAAYDDAQMLDAMDRAASVTLGFDVNERGDPENITVLSASARIWGPQAANLVEGWRFHPGNRGGVAMPVPCVVKLLWGPEDFSAKPIANQLAVVRPQASEPPVYGPIPDYTEEARAAGLEGMVWISFLIGPNGVPADLKVQRSLGMGLDERAMEAIAKWQIPTQLNGQAVQGVGTVEIDFKLTGVTAIFRRVL